MMSMSTKPCLQPGRAVLMWVSLLQASLLTRLTTSAVIDITSYGAVASNKTAYLVKTHDGLIATPHTTSPLLPLVLSILSMLSRTNLRFPARFGMANGVGAGLRG